MTPRDPTQVHLQQLHLPTNQHSQNYEGLQLPTQPIPNLNNKVVQPTYNVEIPHSLTYTLSLVESKDIHIFSRRVIQNKTYIIIQE